MPRLDLNHSRHRRIGRVVGLLAVGLLGLGFGARAAQLALAQESNPPTKAASTAPTKPFTRLPAAELSLIEAVCPTGYDAMPVAWKQEVRVAANVAAPAGGSQSGWLVEPDLWFVPEDGRQQREPAASAPPIDQPAQLPAQIPAEQEPESGVTDPPGPSFRAPVVEPSQVSPPTRTLPQLPPAASNAPKPMKPVPAKQPQPNSSPFRAPLP